MGGDLECSFSKIPHLYPDRPLVLSILQYQGDYIESRKIEINGLLDCEKHGLAYKIFPSEKDR